MGAPRLVSLFRSLDGREIKKFGQFFQSPYYNATPKMRALYRYLKKTHPECPFEENDKESLFAKIFDKETYTPRKMNNLTASLSSILQDFLLLQSMKKETPARKKGLFEVYRKRKLHRLSHQQLMGLKKGFEKQRDTATFRHYESLKVHHELYFHSRTPRVRWKEKEDSDYLKTAQQELDLLYAHLRLRYIVEMIFRDEGAKKKIELTQEETDNIQHLIAHYRAPLLEIYWLLYNVLQTPDKTFYNRLRDKVFEYINDYKPTEFIYLLTFLKNYQSFRLVSGDVYALHEFFNLYLFDLERSIYIEETGHFSTPHFINISVTASELGKTDWLAGFIAEKQENLHADVKENIVNMSMAFLHFAQGQYDETLRLATLLKRTVPAFMLACWTLEIRAYYMMKDEYENWDSSIKRFQAYLRNQDNLGKERKQANRNFNTFIRLLYRTAYHNTYTKEELLTKLESQKNIVCKYWLTKQIEQLK